MDLTTGQRALKFLAVRFFVVIVVGVFFNFFLQMYNSLKFNNDLEQHLQLWNSIKQMHPNQAHRSSTGPLLYPLSYYYNVHVL